MSSFDLRPHHGLCIAFFAGKGYSDAFVAHMTAQIAILEQENPTVHLVPGDDRICMVCPHLQNGICESHAKSERYDKAVLTYCNLAYEDRLSWRQFTDLVHTRILDRHLLANVCGDCCWYAICSQAQ